MIAKQYKATLEHRITLRSLVDSLAFIFVFLFVGLILLSEFGHLDLNKYLVGKNVLSCMLVAAVLRVLRFRIWTCPKCQKSLKLIKHRGQMFEAMPDYCPSCALNLKEVLDKENSQRAKIKIWPHFRGYFTSIGTLCLFVYGMYKYGFFSRYDLVNTIVPAIVMLAGIIIIALIIAKLKACRSCGMPFQTGKDCRRCGESTQ
jgi:hypothetical protein